MMMDPLTSVKAQKYVFMHKLQKWMGGAIIWCTTESKTNEETLVTGLPPKLVMQFIICLSDSEYALLNHELHVVGEEQREA
jgi:hypothetical protein